MFIKYDDQSIRYTGRFGQFRTWHNDAIAATACGAYFELAFGGRDCVLNFCTEFSTETFGHHLAFGRRRRTCRGDDQPLCAPSTPTVTAGTP